MPDWLSIHEPILVNTIGHCAGAVIFGMLLYFFLVNRRRAGDERSSLPAVAAALAMLWNLGSLVALAAGPSGNPIAGAIGAFSFSVLSLLPAVLLHISLQSRRRAVWIAGYVLSGIAVALHLADWFTHVTGLHYAALLVVTLGFAGLTILSVILEWRQENRASGSRLAGAMGLFLFAISFAHFGAAHSQQLAWSKEAALHHAGLPLALLVLLQDYRFLLMDAFLRFIVNATLAAAALLATIRILQSRVLAAHLQHPFDAGVIFVSAGLLLTLFVWVHNRIQSLLTSAIFLRSNVDEALRELQDLSLAAGGEAEYVRLAAEAIARFLHAPRCDLTERNPTPDRPLAAPVAVLDASVDVPSWVHAVLPMRFSRGDAAYLLLGPRNGGRRYLSEDLSVLARLGAAVTEHVEQLRNVQMQNLMSQAELKALQAQINPHFLFNSLNTLYGTIDRANAEARRLVLNLADVYRYLLRSERAVVTVEEELRIVRAYLEIEELRLGSKLHTEVDADPGALPVSIPLLSIQPLVENAVKHGVASRVGSGFVHLKIRADGQSVSVEVSNSGEWDRSSSGRGIGLSNVRRRLELCYGPDAVFDIRAADGLTIVAFTIPVAHRGHAGPGRDVSPLVGRPLPLH
ncbi:MAG: histidine kinase [Bryobacteraceae bacterium]|jgi:two-component sensor histidine kinase